MTDSILPRAGDVALIVVDIQERLVPAMHDAEGVIRGTNTLLQVAAEYAWPVVVSEQYPKGLGHTVEPLKEALDATSPQRFEKTAFSLARHDDFVDNCMRKLPNNLVVVGMETHVCVLQTVADLQNRGYQCFVPYDAVTSRTTANHENGLELIRRTGGVVVNVESLLFHTLGDAKAPAFKQLSKLIR